jgi:hypothetical protein
MGTAPRSTKRHHALNEPGRPSIEQKENISTLRPATGFAAGSASNHPMCHAQLTFVGGVAALSSLIIY